MERVRTLWDDRRGAPRLAALFGRRRHAVRSPRTLQHGGRLRAARAVAARRVRGDPPGRDRRRAAIRGRAGAPRRRSRRRRRSQLLRPHPRSREGACRPAADLRARRPPDQRVGRGGRAPATRLRRRGGRRGVVVIPRAGRRRPGGRRYGHGVALHLAGGPRRRLPPSARADPPPPRSISLAGIPLEQAPCLPPGTVHVAVTGTAMHWVVDAAGLASTGSVFPGYPDHVDEAERRAWRMAAARQWRAAARDARHRTRAGRPVHRRAPGLPGSVPRQDRGLRRDRRRT